MRSAAKIITRLSSRGITLTPDGDRLHARPASRLTQQDLALIRQHKAGVVQLLTEMKAAADDAVNKPPRQLEPREKAAIAQLIRLEHEVGEDMERLRVALDCPPEIDVVNVYIREAIVCCQDNASTRQYLLTLAKRLEEDAD